MYTPSTSRQLYHMLLVEKLNFEAPNLEPPQLKKDTNTINTPSDPQDLKRIYEETQSKEISPRHLYNAQFTH